MKRYLSFFVMLLLVTVPAFSANFSPTRLVLSTPATVHYDFDGSSINIPLTVSGTAGAGFFVVSTKDQADKIGVVQNGHLGWHYINGIDTCVYVSSFTQFSVGSNTITWNGKDSDGGGMVPAGEYNYYVWAYDHINSKTLVTKYMSLPGWNRTTILTHGTDGKPLANPIQAFGPTRYLSGVIDSEGRSNLHDDINSQWTIGNDPNDASLLETCQTSSWAICGNLAFLPTDHSMFFIDGHYDNQSKITRKWKWIPNGAGVLQTDWGEEGAFVYASYNKAGWEVGPGVESDGKDYLIMGDGDISGGTTVVRLFYVDVNDGTEIKRFDMSEWWVRPEDGEAGGQASQGATDTEIRYDRMLVSNVNSCVYMLIDPYYENDEDAILFVNQNGDYVADKNFASDSTKPWVCVDYNVAPWKYNMSMDRNLFSGVSLYDFGAVSFAWFAPDGTGLGTLAAAGEAAGVRSGFKIIDYDSPFDGLLCDNATTASDEEGKTGVWWLGIDSTKGIISSAPTSVDETPASFTVAQNSPNPFNPSTAISFTIPEAGDVSVTVYNVAGQKVAVIADDIMSAGSHSVVWDATGFSAGVYFYTVKSGVYSRSMKMTLLK